MEKDYKKEAEMNASGFVLLSDYVPGIVQEIRYFSTYNFVGDRVDGYEQPCAILTKEAARALKAISNKANVMGYRLKVFDAYRPAAAVRHFTLWGVEDLDQRMKPFFSQCSYRSRCASVRAFQSMSVCPSQVEINAQSSSRKNSVRGA